MKLCRWGLFALCALWVGCADFGKAETEFCDRNPASCAGATVVLDPAVNATCVLVEIRDSANGTVLETLWLPRLGNTLPLEIRQGTMPERVELAARPFLDGSCAGGTQARTPNGPFVTGTALFVEGLAEAAPLKIEPGVDADNDQYVAAASDGEDCDDTSGAVNPGAAEVCTDQVDLNCDLKRGCEATTCSAQACGGPVAVEVTIPGSLTAGLCVSGGTVTLKDSAGVNSRASVDTSVSLQSTPSNGVGFSADASCTTAVTRVTIPANSSSASFFVQGQLVGNVTVTASVTGLTQGTQAASVNPGSGKQLAFLGTTQTVTAGACSPQPVRIQSQDAQGNPMPVTVATAVSLAAQANSNFEFFSDASCAAATKVTSVNLAVGASNASFYFRSTKAGSVLVTIAASGFVGASQAQTITAAAPSVIVVAGPVTVAAATCSAAISVSLRDAFGNPATAATNMQITLNRSSSQLSLFSNGACTTAVPGVTIVAGNGSTNFFVRATQSAAYSVTATGSGLTNGTVSVTVMPGPASVLAFTTAPQSVPAGVCSGIVAVQLRDANGNPVSVTSPTAVTLSMSEPLGFQFFTDPACNGNAVTATSIATGTTTASFFFKGTKAVTNATLSASVNGINGTQSVTITASAPSKLAFVSSPQGSVVNQCSPPLVVQVQDVYDNPVTVSSSIWIDLSASSLNVNFYGDSSCTAQVAGTSVPTNQSTVGFHLKGNVSEDVIITVRSSGLNPASQLHFIEF